MTAPSQSDEIAILLEFHAGLRAEIVSILRTTEILASAFAASLAATVLATDGLTHHLIFVWALWLGYFLLMSYWVGLLIQMGYIATHNSLIERRPNQLMDGRTELILWEHRYSSKFMGEHLRSDFGNGVSRLNPWWILFMLNTGLIVLGYIGVVAVNVISIISSDHSSVFRVISVAFYIISAGGLLFLLYFLHSYAARNAEISRESSDLPQFLDA